MRENIAPIEVQSQDIQEILNSRTNTRGLREQELAHHFGERVEQMEFKPSPDQEDIIAQEALYDLEVTAIEKSTPAP
jgi:hypothetical protein